MLLSIETSCDETAVAVSDLDLFLERGSFSPDLLKADFISSQIKLHQAYGGVVPELASREHLKNLPVLINQAFSQAKISVQDIKAVAVTRGPGLKGCLLVGLCFAKSFALSNNIPLLALNHMEGHLWAGFIECDIEFPFLALVVSGGHTQLVLVNELGDYQVIANTRDDAAGEAFDKIATLLSLPYPGGPHLSALAEKGKADAFKFPVGMPEDAESFSFSGLKTSVQRLAQGLREELEESRADVAASVQKTIVDTLVLKTRMAIEKYKPKSLLLTGGVAANKALRVSCEGLAKDLSCNFYVPHPKYCTDNAAMIACLASYKILKTPEEYLSWQGADNNYLGPNVLMDVGAEARFPLGQLV